MLYFGGTLTLIFQGAMAVHVVRAGRNLMWIFIILFFPLVGSLVYLFAEVIPEMERRNTLQYWLADVERFFSNLFK
jgi:hypothetical protein